MNRREFLQWGAFGLAATAAPFGRVLLNVAKDNFLAPKVKSLIVLYMTGGPSHLDLFDFKPELIRNDGKSLTVLETTAESPPTTLLKPISGFAQHGESGAWVSALLPELAKMVDDLTFIKSVNANTKNHSFAQLEFNTCSTNVGNPHSGAWLNFGLGEVKNKLPRSIIMTDPLGLPNGKSPLWNTLGLPYAQNQLVLSDPGLIHRQLTNSILAQDEEVLFKNMLDKSEEAFLQNHLERKNLVHLRKEVMGSMFAMCDELKTVFDMSKVTDEEKALYHLSDPECAAFAKQLLAAKRLAEGGVPFIQIYCGNESFRTSWDHHTNISNIVGLCKRIDGPTAGFLTDLKRSGILDHAVVLWGGEFGRMPISSHIQNYGVGRDHNPYASTVWMAGAGLKKGSTLGETDDIGLYTVKDRVEMGDIWATIAHLMGINHRQLKYTIQGVERRFTKAHHKILGEILS